MSDNIQFAISEVDDSVTQPRAEEIEREALRAVPTLGSFDAAPHTVASRTNHLGQDSAMASHDDEESQATLTLDQMQAMLDAMAAERDTVAAALVVANTALKKKPSDFKVIDYGNYIKQLSESWDGTDLPDWTKELIDNGCDANKKLNSRGEYVANDDFTNKIINVYTENKNFICQDNMIGVTCEDVMALLTFHNQNLKRLKQSIGKFGIGANKAILAILSLVDILKDSCTSTFKRETHVMIIGKHIDKSGTTSYYYNKINYVGMKTIGECQDQFEHNEKKNDEAKILWERYNNIPDSASGTIIVIPITSNIQSKFKNFSENSKNILNLAQTYEIYINNGLTINIQNKKIVGYEKVLENYYRQEFCIKVYTDGDVSKLVYGDKAIRKSTGGYSKDLIDDVADGLSYRGKFTLNYFVPKKALSIVAKTGELYFDPNYIPPEFSDYYMNNINSGIDEYTIKELYKEKYNKTLVLRESRCLGVVASTHGKITGHRSAQSYDSVLSELCYPDVMDEIIKLIQANKSRLNLNGALPNLDRIIGCCKNLFIENVKNNETSSAMCANWEHERSQEKLLNDIIFDASSASKEAAEAAEASIEAAVDAIYQLTIAMRGPEAVNTILQWWRLLPARPIPVRVQKNYIQTKRAYLVNEGRKSKGTEVFKDDSGNEYLKMIIGITEQDIIKRMNGGNYYKRTARHWRSSPISNIAYEKTTSGHAIIEDVLLIELRKTPGIREITNEEFKVPIDSVPFFVKTFDRVCAEYFRI